MSFETHFKRSSYDQHGALLLVRMTHNHSVSDIILTVDIGEQTSDVEISASSMARSNASFGSLRNIAFSNSSRDEASIACVHMNQSVKQSLPNMLPGMDWIGFKYYVICGFF